MYTLRQIDGSLESYEQIIYFYQQNKNKRFENIHISLSDWFDASMSAVLGGVLDLLIQKGNTIVFDAIPSNIQTILQKNEFLSYYGQDVVIDTHKTTAKYKKFEPNREKQFQQYILQELLERHEFTKFSDFFKENIMQSFAEIFDNATLHSETEYIYTCGQYFPAKNRMDFIIVDTGIGFQEAFYRRFGKIPSAEKVISWATELGNTTKDFSGGAGLTGLIEWVCNHQGKIQIISHSGFFEHTTKGISTKLLDAYFPGTIVSLQFSTIQ